MEAAAIEAIFSRTDDGSLTWIASEALATGIESNQNLVRRDQTAALLIWATENVEITGPISIRATSLERLGYGPFDSLHLACAEAAAADALLTTDDAFIRKAARGIGSPLVPVRNPLSWSQEH